MLVIDALIVLLCSILFRFGILVVCAWLIVCCWYFCRVVCWLFRYLWFACCACWGLCVLCSVGRCVAVMAVSVSGCLLLIYICFEGWLVFSVC